MAGDGISARKSLNAIKSRKTSLVDVNINVIIMRSGRKTMTLNFMNTLTERAWRRYPMAVFPLKYQSKFMELRREYRPSF